jgi:hypothetical protein
MWPRVPAQERRAENRARACDFAIFCIDSEIFGAPTDSTGSIAHAEGASTAIVVRCADGPAQSVLANTQDLDAFAHVFCAPTVCPRCLCLCGRRICRPSSGRCQRPRSAQCCHGRPPEQESCMLCRQPFCRARLGCVIQPGFLMPAVDGHEQRASACGQSVAALG